METREVIKIIQKMAKTGKPVVASGRCEKERLFTFVPAQLAKRPVDYFREYIHSQTIVGKKSKDPIVLKMPIVIAAMSFGALSKNAKIALAKASSMVGAATNTGEGGMLPEERAIADVLIAQYSTGRFGVTPEYLISANAIEIKIGQGAKPGQGGLLPGSKVTPEIAKVRSTGKIKIVPGQDIHSPPYHPDILTIKDLKEKVKWLRKITFGKPIIIKLGAGDIERDLKFALKAKPDVIAIDGKGGIGLTGGGGTGAAPRVMLEGVGISTFPALVRSRKYLDQVRNPPELWIGGGFNLGEEVAAALALGAEVVFMGFAPMIAMGCTYCRQCYKGECPKGIATQDPEKVKKLNVDEAAQKVANYLKALNEEVKMIAGAIGLDDVHKLKKEHLRVTDPKYAREFGVKSEFVS